MENLRPDDVPGPLPTPRRVFTAPTTLQSSRGGSSSSRSQSGGIVETLYNHPSVKIIAFPASARSALRSPSVGPTAEEDEEAGSLPTSSQLERTIAVGMCILTLEIDSFLVNNGVQGRFAYTEHPDLSPSSAAVPPSNPSCPKANAGPSTKSRASSSCRSGAPTTGE
jgi:hypothetical protein